METLSQVADDLFELVIDIDPGRTTWEQISEQAPQRASVLALRAEALKGEISSAKIDASIARTLEGHLTSLSKWLRELADALGQRTSDHRWRALYVGLARSYDDLVGAAAAARIGNLRRFRRLSPANHSRSLFHAAAGVVGALTYHFLLDRQGALLVIGLLVATFTGLEILRRTSTKANDAMMRFAPIRRTARAREYYQINSSTYYGWGMLLSVLFFSQEAVEAGCLVLAFGDPMASYLGRRFGRVKLFLDKSVVGTLAFFGAGFLAVLAFQRLVYPELPLGHSLLLSAVAAGAGAVGELFTLKLDDNFTVPVATALAVTLMF